jgi:hypothetical protein
MLGALSSEVKRPGSEADHSPQSNTEDKNGRAIPPPPYALMALCLITYLSTRTTSFFKVLITAYYDFYRISYRASDEERTGVLLLVFDTVQKYRLFGTRCVMCITIQ